MYTSHTMVFSLRVLVCILQWIQRLSAHHFSIRFMFHTICYYCYGFHLLVTDEPKKLHIHCVRILCMYNCV